MQLPQVPSGVQVWRPQAQSTGVSHQRAKPGTHWPVQAAAGQPDTPAQSESAQSILPSQSSSPPPEQLISRAVQVPVGPSVPEQSWSTPSIARSGVGAAAPSQSLQEEN